MGRSTPDVHVMEQGGVIVLDKQIRLSVALIALSLTLVANFAAVVWSASRMSSSIAALNQTTARLELTLTRVAAQAADLESRVRVVEDRTGNHRRER